MIQFNMDQRKRMRLLHAYEFKKNPPGRVTIKKEKRKKSKQPNHFLGLHFISLLPALFILRLGRQHVDTVQTARSYMKKQDF